jgi:sensor histidine kinase YesM
MNWIQRTKGLWQKLIEYARAHLWFSLIGTMMLVFLLTALVFQSYLKNQYFDYLVNETWQTEQVALDTAADNLDGQLKEALRVGSEIALHKNLRNLVDVVVSFSLNHIVESGSLVGNQQGYICGYLTDEEETIIYHEEKESIGMSNEAYIEETGAITLERSLRYFGWNAHIAIDTEEIQNDVNLMCQRGIAAYIILLFLCALLWDFLMRRILHPIDTIVSAMKEVQKGASNQKIEVKGTNELWQLAEQYNNMIDALQRQQEEVQRQFNEKTQSIEQKNRAERTALESQINAHFLCNTLNAINYNVIEAGNYEVATLLKKLSNILYYTFSQKSPDVTLGQELDWVQQYLYLQKYRLGDRFSYEVNFPEEYREWPCCKLVLQPFVENSILHGFENREKGGMIWITGQPEEGRFRLELRDNGCGMPPEVRQGIQKTIETGETLSFDGTGTGIGIRNVITRLKMFYGEQFAVAMNTAEGEGTSFTFWLPIPPSAEQDDWLDECEEGVL